MTETLVFQGHSPTNQYDALRAALREGDFPGPVPVLRGRSVFSLYPHQTASVVSARAVVPTPDDAETLSTWLGDGDLRRRLRHAAEQRHVTRSGWLATADQIFRIIAEAV